MRGRIEITRTYRWPTRPGRRCPPRRRRRAACAPWSSYGPERTSSASTSRSTTRADDHRVRVSLPLPRADIDVCCGVRVRHRRSAASRQRAAPTSPPSVVPHRRFVRADGVLIVHEGLPEYELVDLMRHPRRPRAATLALTVLRSVGVLSQGPSSDPFAARPGPAIPTPGAQLLGPRTAAFLVHLGVRDPYAVADDAFTPLLTAGSPAGEASATRRSSPLPCRSRGQRSPPFGASPTVAASCGS